MWLQEIADMAFGPLVSLLSNVVAWLSSVSLVAARGIDVARYMGYIAWLGPAWLAVVRDALLAVVLVTCVMVARTAWSVYLQAKQGVKWW